VMKTSRARKGSVMEAVFGETYADVYDLLYGEKDYAAECDILEDFFRRYGDGSLHKILDLGCGTGNHALILAGRGYEVVGVDRSQRMLDHLRKKAAGLSKGLRPSFHRGDICTLELKERFDVALMMFAVLGYQIENRSVLSALCTARRHLRVGGLLIFDVWFGPAVLAERPSDRLKIISTAKGRLLRFASSELDILNHTCRVNYRIWGLERERLMEETEEEHLMRYFFPKELELFLEHAKFSLMKLTAFPESNQDPSEKSWNVIVVANAA
jgi:SAM-dependent methyltransferase